MGGGSRSAERKALGRDGERAWEKPEPLGAAGTNFAALPLAPHWGSGCAGGGGAPSRPCPPVFRGRPRSRPGARVWVWRASGARGGRGGAALLRASLATGTAGAGAGALTRGRGARGGGGDGAAACFPPGVRTWLPASPERSLLMPAEAACRATLTAV